MARELCGIYEIRCAVSGKSYVGSSCAIYKRWHGHRRHLRLGTHASPRLQQAWNKHGEAKFVFSVLEECERAVLFAREQHHIDVARRDYNSMPKVRVITPEIRRKMTAGIRRHAASITHCPSGHEYAPENTRISTKGDRLCRECARIRSREAIARETPAQKADRLSKGRAYNERNKEYRVRQQSEYVARTKEQKRVYDIAYRPIKNARRRARAAELGHW